MSNQTEHIVKEYHEFLADPEFPCVAAKAAQSKNHIHSFVAGHMACPADDAAILKFIYDFVALYRAANKPFFSAAVIFTGPSECTETDFDAMLWSRLSALNALDKSHGYHHDPRVDADPASPTFSFSMNEEAFFIVGLNPASPRRSRRFKYPTLVFNPHAEFEKLRSANRYDKMKRIVRKRDIEFSGSVNPVLSDFGSRSEVHQYSGVPHPSDWVCPLKTYQ